VAADDASLRGRQLRFVRAIMAGDASPGAFDEETAAKWLTPGPRMSALERFDVYRRGYRARLVECLADDYPATRHALGDDAFDDLCGAYIARFPSSGPSLNDFGRRMGEFLREGAPAPLASRAFVADLAAFEWAIVEVIHAASEPHLTQEALLGVPANGWGAVRFEATPAFRLLHLDYPANEYYQAFREGRSPSIPERAPSRTIVYRSDLTVWRMDLTEAMAAVLAALVASEPLGDALARAEAHLAELDEAEVSSRVTAWFREWLGHGLFVRARW
jgi:hypothetical protein